MAFVIVQTNFIEVHLTFRITTVLVYLSIQTSGSPVSILVWMSIFPSLTSLSISQRACSIVSPARNTDTPTIYNENKHDT